ncbi:MAG: CRISPR-associated protein Cas4 [Candidatus Omnitrophica bacterium]|nr:CRISPR-associated protein Cas4 [Candidatus Omnitrophota bacterium]
MLDFIEPKITATQVAYYIVCKRKLWLFSHGLGMEQFSDFVEMGKVLSEDSFKREKHKEVMLGDTIKVDFLKVGDEITVNEVKKSRKLEEAHIWQTKYYIYKIQQTGAKCTKGVIHYPKLMRKIDVVFDYGDKKNIEDAEKKIKQIISMDRPPEVVNKPYCKNCAYFEFCYI